LAAFPASAQVQVTAITGVRVFDGEQVLSNMTVLLREGRIAALGRQVQVPREAVVISGVGKTLLPGFIDAHVHTYGNSRADALRFGVTTELDMFTDWHALAQFKRDREDSSSHRAADVYSAGTLVTVENGHGTEFTLAIPTLDRAEDADAFIAARVAEGSDFIKLVLEDGSITGHSVPTLSEPSVRAAIQAAKARNKLAVVHVSTERDAMLALEAGADGLVHVFQDRPASDAFIALARERHAFVVPTLSVIDQSGPGSGPTLVHAQRMRTWINAEQGLALMNPFPQRSNSEQCSRNAKQSVRRLRAAGVPILAGTDAGNPGTAHGASLHGELQLLQGAGLSALDALASATSIPARHFGLGDRGRIAVGMRADLVLVQGDPTKELAATRAIVAIWKNGQQVDRSIEVTPGVPAPQRALVSDFEIGKPAANYGNGWQITTDDVIGGSSSAAFDVVRDGAQGTRGSLQITGEVRLGADYPWGGAALAFGTKAHPLDFSAKRELVFWAKSDRPGVVMLYSGDAPQPAIVPFAATLEWAEQRVPFEKFKGAELQRVRAISFAASNPPGKFQLSIDQVEIR
jgi:imidazolonepropionase-like amidohydrolase